MSADTFTTTVDGAAAHAEQFADDEWDDRPDPADYADLTDTERFRPDPLPDPYRCFDPWCPSAAQGQHKHGTRPDGVRV